MHSLLLLFQNAKAEHCAVPIELVTRIERVRPAAGGAIRRTACGRCSTAARACR